MSPNVFDESIQTKGPYSKKEVQALEQKLAKMPLEEIRKQLDGLSAQVENKLKSANTGSLDSKYKKFLTVAENLGLVGKLYDQLSPEQKGHVDTYTRESSERSVAVAQSAFMKLGFLSPDTVLGVFDKETLYAVISFQKMSKDYKGQQDGLIGKQTLAALQKALEDNPKNIESSPSTTTVVELQAIQEEIKTTQQKIDVIQNKKIQQEDLNLTPIAPQESLVFTTGSTDPLVDATTEVVPDITAAQQYVDVVTEVIKKPSYNTMETIPAKTISAPEVSKTPIAPTDKKMLTENMHPATEVTPGENVSTKEKTETPEISSNQVNLHLSPEAKKDIGNQIWKNEAGGTVEGLTTWNKGETFASLGIGHFLWLPENSKAPYDDKFKSLLKYMEDKKIKMPSWLTSNTPNPWKTKEEFDRDFNTPKMKELRDFLTTTIPMQTEFIVDRIEQSLPKMIENADPSKSQQIKDNFAKVLNSGAPGVFALTDYVNFKGEGTEKFASHNNISWGLQQVLEKMQDTGNPVQDFANAAKEVLRNRVANAPVQSREKEKKWLVGWENRIDGYQRIITNQDKSEVQIPVLEKKAEEETPMVEKTKEVVTTPVVEQTKEMIKDGSSTESNEAINLEPWSPIYNTLDEYVMSYMDGHGQDIAKISKEELPNEIKKHTKEALLANPDILRYGMVLRAQDYSKGVSYIGTLIEDPSKKDFSKNAILHVNSLSAQGKIHVVAFPLENIVEVLPHDKKVLNPDQQKKFDQLEAKYHKEQLKKAKKGEPKTETSEK